MHRTVYPPAYVHPPSLPYEMPVIYRIELHQHTLDNQGDIILLEFGYVPHGSRVLDMWIREIRANTL